VRETVLSGRDERCPASCRRLAWQVSQTLNEDDARRLLAARLEKEVMQSEQRFNELWDWLHAGQDV